MRASPRFSASPNFNLHIFESDFRIVFNFEDGLDEKFSFLFPKFGLWVVIEEPHLLLEKKQSQFPQTSRTYFNTNL